MSLEFTPCPDCGAVFKDGSTCQDVFENFLALEFSDPAYGEVHFFTVACFMIQHRRYSRAALGWIARQLRDSLENGVTIQHIRRQAQQQVRQDERSWKVLRPPDEPLPEKIPWSVTIADVAGQAQDADLYCAGVLAWARATLTEMKY